MKKFYTKSCTMMLMALVALMSSIGISAQETAKVTMSYANEAARKSIGMIRNVTTNTSIAFTAIDEFEVTVGDVVRFNFTTRDYAVIFDGEEVPTTSQSYTNVEKTIEGDVTLTVSAQDRSYAEVTLAIWTNEPEAIHVTGANGKAITDLTATGRSEEHKFRISQTQSKTVTVYEYTFDVSEKDGKAFVGANDGYWIENSANSEDPDIETTMTSTLSPLYVLAHKIEADTKLVVWVRYNSSEVELPVMRDKNHDFYDLKAGYNEFEIDPSYCSPFSIMVYNANSNAESADPTVAVYNNGTAQTQDDNGIINTTVDGPSVLHIFAGVSASKKITVTAKLTADASVAGATVEVDHLNDITDGGSATTFVGCQATITANGQPVYVNGESIDELDSRYVSVTDGVYTLTLSGDTTIDVGSDNSSMLTSIGTESVSAPVYNIQGMLISNDASGVNTLPHGLYIINGRKHIVR